MFTVKAFYIICLLGVVSRFRVEDLNLLNTYTPVRTELGYCARPIYRSVKCVKKTTYRVEQNAMRLSRTIS